MGAQSRAAAATARARGQRCSCSSQERALFRDKGYENLISFTSAEIGYVDGLRILTTIYYELKVSKSKLKHVKHSPKLAVSPRRKLYRRRSRGGRHRARSRPIPGACTFLGHRLQSKFPHVAE